MSVFDRLWQRGATGAAISKRTQERKFRERPIEAWHFSEAQDPKPSWLTAAITRGTVWYQGGSEPYFTIGARLGEVRVMFGDWIVRDARGVLSRWADDAFRKTYEEVLG